MWQSVTVAHPLSVELSLYNVDTYYDGDIEPCGRVWLWLMPCLYSCPTHSVDTYHEGDIDHVEECGCGSAPVCTAVLHILMILTMMVR